MNRFVAISRIALLIFALPSLSRAQPEPAENVETRVTRDAQVKRDDFIKTTFVYGKEYLSETRDEDSRIFTTYGLDALRKDGGEVYYFFTIDILIDGMNPISYPRWSKVVDTDGTAFKLSENEKEIDRSKHQSVSFGMKREYLEMVVAKTGIKMRFYGKGQTMDFKLPQPLIEELLKLVDETFAAR